MRAYAWAGFAGASRTVVEHQVGLWFSEPEQGIMLLMFILLGPATAVCC